MFWICLAALAVLAWALNEREWPPLRSVNPTLIASAYWLVIGLMCLAIAIYGS